jgi:pimeloyl-ACP methyl ester carboxylesterase
MSSVLLLHAFPCDHTLWSAQAASVSAAGFGVIAPDLPGFGGAALLGGEPDLRVVATALLDSTDDERLHVVGLSLGGYLAMEMLRQAPHRVASLCLIDTKAADDAPDAQQRRLDMAAAVLAAGDTAALVDVMPAQLLGAEALATRPDLVDRVKSWIQQAPAPTVAWYQRAMAKRPDSHALLRECDVPVTIIWGDADVMSTRTEQDRMRDAMPLAAFCIVEGAGHLSAIEKPDQVSEHLLRHLANQRPPE